MWEKRDGKNGKKKRKRKEEEDCGFKLILP